MGNETPWSEKSYHASMAVRLDFADEYMHELGPESNFNESMYLCRSHCSPSELTRPLPFGMML